MTYQCLNPECKKVFTHTATVTSETTDLIIEKRVCPFCLGLDFEEYVEPVVDEKIVSVISVEIGDVDAKLKEGYEVREVYAKNAVLQKKEKQA